MLSHRRISRSVIFVLAAGAAGWATFLSGEALLQLRPAIAELLLPKDYADRYFALVLFLLALAPVLLGVVVVGIRRKQLSLLAGVATVVLYLGVNYCLLKRVEPFFISVFPG